LCTSAQHLHVALHNGGNDKAFWASAQQLHVSLHNGQQQGLVHKHTPFSTSGCMTATTARPCVQALTIFKITSHDGNNDKAL
jgi:hypothetical protein